MGLGTLAIPLTPVLGASGADGAVLHQEIDFKVSPERIYEILLDEKLFTAFSGGKADIRREAGGAFKLFQGIPKGHIRPERRADTEPADCPSVARGVLAARRLLDRKIRAEGAGHGDTDNVRSGGRCAPPHSGELVAAVLGPAAQVLGRMKLVQN